MEPTKRCPYCGELILRIAIRCKHCQSDLRSAEQADAPSAPHVVAPPPVAGFPYAAYGVPLPAAPHAPALQAHPPQAPLSQPAAPQAFAPLPGSGPSSAAVPGVPSGPHIPQASDSAGLVAAIAASMASGPGLRAGTDSNPFPRVEPYTAPTEGSFEQRFLDFAFKTNLPINPATVAYALKIPIDEADEGLLDLAARDVLMRDVDSRGVVTYQLPGRSAVAAAQGGPSSLALSPYAQPPQMLYDPPGALAAMPNENTALAGLLVNVCFPGLGSLIGGKTSAGVFQLLMFLLGLPLSIVFIGFPMWIGAWVWGIVTGVNMLNEAKQLQHRQRLAGG